MSAWVMTYVAMALGPALTSTARPMLTVLAVQVVAAVGVSQGGATMPGELEVLLTAPALGLVALLAGLEAVAATDAELETLKQDLKLDQVMGALVATGSAMAMNLVGVEEGLEEGSEAAGMLESLAVVAEADLAMEWQVAVVTGALAVHLGVGWIRRRVVRWLYEAELSRWWAIVEGGGILVALILLPFFPAVVLVALVLWVLLLAVAAVVTRQLEAMWEAKWRESCEGCDYQVRREASRCPQCGQRRQPAPVEPWWR